MVSILGVFLVALFRVGSLHAPFCKSFFVRSTTNGISAGFFEEVFLLRSFVGDLSPRFFVRTFRCAVSPVLFYRLFSVECLRALIEWSFSSERFSSSFIRKIFGKDFPCALW